jgi:hypothetical protein
MLRRPNVVIASVAAITIALLWLVPPVGFIAVLVMLVIAPPWGRSLAERAIISMLILLGIIAIGFASGSSTPITSTSAHLILTVVLAGATALRFLPMLNQQRIPRPRVSDGFLLAIAIGLWAWLTAPFAGKSDGATLSGLIFSGWDNQAHFTTYANSVTMQSNLWQTIDGSIAWNQWYPNLHTTVWSLGNAALGSDPETSRLNLLSSYVQWSAISVALCLAALAWVAGDLAERFAKLRNVSMAAAGIVAVLAFGAFAFLGSPTQLFNAGFTNFLMAVTVMTTAAYLSARSWQSARKLGWFLVPLAAVAVSGLWTPLVAGLIVAGVAVLIALWRTRTVLAVVWAIATMAVVLITVLRQAQAILGVDSALSTTEFAQTLGAVPVGMVGFNITAAITFPIIAVIIGTVLIRERQHALGLATAGTSLGVVIVLVVALRSAAAADTAWQVSYYVLKVLDAMLLSTAPIIAALLAASVVVVVRSVGRVMAVTGSAVALLLGISFFGYIGPAPTYLNYGFQAAPGIAAAAERNEAVANTALGESIVASVLAAEPYPDRYPLLWNTPGTLPNLWAGTLHTVLSADAQSLYISLPEPPYADSAVAYVNFSLNIYPGLNLAVLWSDPASKALVNELAARAGDRIVLIEQ